MHSSFNVHFFLCVGGTFWLLTVLVISISLVILIIRKWFNLRFNNSRNKSSKRNTAVVVDESEMDSKKQVFIVKSSDNGFDETGVISLPDIWIENLHPFKIEYYSRAIECKFPLDLSWEFPRDGLTITKTIGEGHFGHIFKAKARGVLGKKGVETPNENQTGSRITYFWRIIDVIMKIIWKACRALRKQEQTTVVVKTLNEKQTGSRITCFLREIEIMKIIGNHENIVNLLGCCTQDGPLYAIIEYAHLGDLHTYLVKRKDDVSTKSMISFASQVAKGMEHLANMECIHRDLAARNVLVFRSNTVKIADFGLARDLRGSKYCHPLESEPIPFRWRAPETLLNNIHESNSDV